MTRIVLKVGSILVALLVLFALVRTIGSTSAVQLGYPGTGMEQIRSNSRVDEQLLANVVPAAFPPAPQDGQLAVDAYKNVQVLGHLTSGEFTRLMAAITTWVAPTQGCVYCHPSQHDASGKVVVDDEGRPLADPNRMDGDEVYAKRVARRMLQMTMHLNTDWKSHVKETGVTCYTCHRGNPVPANVWFDTPPDPMASRLSGLGNSAGQNHPASVVGLTSLPSDVLHPFLVDDDGIRVISTAALPIDNRHSVKEAEWTYGLMMNISASLGVNCTYCHNSRSLGEWDVSPPARAQAWYGIRMVRDLNKNYLLPLAGTFPPERLGPTGDGPKLSCATCHEGASKPLLGASMLKDYMALAEAKPQPAKTSSPDSPAGAPAIPSRP
jgi:photosynthetic reaction center cytochrome c subunit